MARAAARALAAYDELPEPALAALLASAANFASADPFVTCAAFSALARRDDERILGTLLKGLSSPPLRGAPAYRPIAQAASWALFDRAVVGKLVLDDSVLTQTACFGTPEVAGPVLMAFGIVDGAARDTLLQRLDELGLKARVELVLTAAAANGDEAVSAPATHRVLASVSADGNVEALDPGERGEIERWSMSLDPATDVQGYSVWLAVEAFKLPVREKVTNPRALKLPERIGVLTTRSFTPAREEFSGPDEGE